MQHIRLILGVTIVSSFFITAYAEDTSKAHHRGMRKEIKSDVQHLKMERREVKQNAQEARTEEKALHHQIREAKQAGDYEKARALKSQLKKTHHKNIGQMQRDHKDVKEARKEVREDLKDKRTQHRKHMKMRMEGRKEGHEKKTAPRR